MAVLVVVYVWAVTTCGAFAAGAVYGFLNLLHTDLPDAELYSPLLAFDDGMVVLHETTQAAFQTGDAMGSLLEKSEDRIIITSLPNPSVSVSPVHNPESQTPVASPESLKDANAEPWSTGSRVTYRTVCVRLCDGYFFPVSFATTRNKFAADEKACHARCASPARLFVYKNPGEKLEAMVDRKGSPYVRLEKAFAFQRGYDPTCTCQGDVRRGKTQIASKKVRYDLKGEDAPQVQGAYLQLKRERKTPKAPPTVSQPEVALSRTDAIGNRVIDTKWEDPVSPPSSDRTRHEVLPNYGLALVTSHANPNPTRVQKTEAKKTPTRSGRRKTAGRSERRQTKPLKVYQAKWGRQRNKRGVGDLIRHMVQGRI